MNKALLTGGVIALHPTLPIWLAEKIAWVLTVGGLAAIALLTVAIAADCLGIAEPLLERISRHTTNG